jgi:hypothetical protein
MDDQISRSAPEALTEALDASVRDIAAGRVGDSAGAQRQARKLLEAFEKTRSGGGETGAKTA